MEFGEKTSKSLAKSLLNLHRSEKEFLLKFATVEQTEAIAAELLELGCTVNVDKVERSLQVTKPPVAAKAAASVE